MLSENITAFDLIIIALYIIAITWWGLRNARNKTSNDYFLAGRNMSWKVVGLSMFAASISTSTLVGHSGATFEHGLVIFNYNLISVLVLVFFAWIFLPFYIKSGVYTMPEFLERRFDHRSKYYFSSITLIAGIFMDVAATLYGSAMIFNIIFPGMGIQLVVIIAAILAASYTIPGGLSSAIKAELVQAVIILAGSLVLAFLAIKHVGSWEVLSERFQETTRLHLIRPLDDEGIPWPALFMALPILGFYFWANNQQLVQRVLTSRSVDDGRKGVLFTGFLTVVTMYLIFIPALKAGVAFPDTDPSDSIFPRMVTEWMPVGLLGVMLAAMIAAMTSSLSACLNAVSTLFTMDFYRRIDKNASSKKLVRVGQISSVVVLIIGAAWAPHIEKFGTLVDYYNEMLSYVGPPIVAAFILGLFWKRANGTGIFAGLLSTVVLALIMTFIAKPYTFIGDLHWLYMAPINFFFTMLVMVIVSLLSAPPPEDKTKGNVLTKQFFRDEAAYFKNIPFYKDFRVWALLLVLFCFLMLGLYW
jgi:SSS family solute:Na+ symporter